MTQESKSRRETCLICLGLALAVLAAYSPLRNAGFVAFDDIDYVTANAKVQHGLSWSGILWAFSTIQASIWHPLTWLSYLVDSQIFGMNPAGFHFTNVLLHAANSVLLFLVVQRMTGEQWPSALIAALFALHPQHVESVAWIAERKDVLSTLFWLLAVGAYVRYTENLKIQISNFKFHYIAALVFFALGLTAKPMLVTLPVILLLLDYWPLRRGSGPLSRLFAEKIPFLVLAAASCAVTILVARHVGVVKSFGVVPLQARLENIPVSYLRYLVKAFWPADLAALYPYEFHRGIWTVAGSGIFLLAVTGLVSWRRREQPYCAVGWFWFLVMLAPVIGLIQVGPFSIADRYSYLSSTGLFIAVVWMAKKWVPALVWILALVAGLIFTWVQAGYWRNSETLFRHAIDVTQSNGLMESNLGKLLFQDGRVDEALPHLLQGVKFAPDYPLPHYNLGQALLAKGDVAGALSQFEIHVAIQPADPIAQFNFGKVLLDHGLAEDAIPRLQKAVDLRPDAADYHYNLAGAFRQTGHMAEAMGQYEKVLKLRPDDVQSASSLAWMLATAPDSSLRNGPHAVQLALRASQLAGGQDPMILGVLAAAFAEARDFPKAAATAQRALQLAGQRSNSALVQTLRTHLAEYRAGRPVRDTGKK